MRTQTFSLYLITVLFFNGGNKHIFGQLKSMTHPSTNHPFVFPNKVILLFTKYIKSTIKCLLRSCITIIGLRLMRAWRGHNTTLLRNTRVTKFTPCCKTSRNFLLNSLDRFDCRYSKMKLNKVSYVLYLPQIWNQRGEKNLILQIIFMLNEKNETYLQVLQHKNLLNKFKFIH